MFIEKLKKFSKSIHIYSNDYELKLNLSEDKKKYIKDTISKEFTTVITEKRKKR